MRVSKLLSVSAAIAVALAGCGGPKEDEGKQALGGKPDPLGPGTYGECRAARQCHEAGKALLCHVPPGNPGNAHEICVGVPAVAAHLENHADYLGCCKSRDGHPGDDGHPGGDPDCDRDEGEKDGEDGPPRDCEHDRGCTPECTEARECREDGKALICHVPPGNPANAHEICVGVAAVPAHLENHRDYLGCCLPHADGDAEDGHGDWDEEKDCEPECAEARECHEAGKALVCHIPPGNPENAHTICIGLPAVPAHLQIHNDYLGCCHGRFDLK